MFFVSESEDYMEFDKKIKRSSWGGAKVANA